MTQNLSIYITHDVLHITQANATYLFLHHKATYCHINWIYLFLEEALISEWVMRLKDEAVNVMGNKNAADYRWILLPLHLWKIIESNYDSGIKISTTPRAETKVSLLYGCVSFVARYFYSRHLLSSCLLIIAH